MRRWVSNRGPYFDKLTMRLRKAQNEVFTLIDRIDRNPEVFRSIVVSRSIVEGVTPVLSSALLLFVASFLNMR